MVSTPYHMEKKAFPGIVGHRHQKPATFDKAIKPDTGWVSGSGEHDGDINLADIYRPAVARDDIDLGPALEVHSGPRRQLCVGFDRRHTTSGSDNLGQHRRIVSGAGTDLKYLLAGGDVKMVKIAGSEAGHPIVEVTTRIDRHENVMVEPARVVIRGQKWVAVWVGDDAPRPRAYELLAPNGGEGLDQLRVT